VGIEIMIYIANHYRPPNLRAAVGIFGRPNVVRNADYVVVLGGGSGTLDEVDLAVSMEKKIIPYGATSGAARNALDRMRADLRLREWITRDLFDALDSCTVADEYIELVEKIIVADRGSGIRE
jgi:predicted Rossmann-fold nucleotide-binding protein